MGRRSNRHLGWLALAAVALVAAVASGATLNKRARLREGPSKDTRLIGWLEAGTEVAVDAERSGWYLVRTTDGQSGYLWRDHLSFEPVAAPTATTTPPAAPTAAAPEPAPVAAPSGDAPVVAELERLRGEVARLAMVQRELVQRVGQGTPPTTAAPIGADGSAGAAILFFGVGAAVGWLFGRFAAGRRERRSRLRV